MHDTTELLDPTPPEAAGLTIAEYEPTAAALAELRQRYDGIAFDVTTKDGDKSAREARRELVSLRTALEARRKELKAPALDYSRRVDAEAKRLTDAILQLEGPIDAQIKSEEARRERERMERIERERQRVAALQARVDAIKAFPVRAAGKGSVVIAALIEDMGDIVIDESFEEFQQAASDAYYAALNTLNELHEAAQASEEEARKLREEREQMRREQEAAAEKIRAEREAQEAELRAERERQAAERAEIDRQRAELEAAQRAQREAEEAAQRQREAEERSRAQIEAAEKREAEARARDEYLAAERARDERMARLSEAAEAMLAALYAVRNSEAWKAIGARTRDEVLAAIAAAEGAPEQTAA